jgi:hypothetical protein
MPPFHIFEKFLAKFTFPYSRKLLRKYTIDENVHEYDENFLKETVLEKKFGLHGILVDFRKNGCFPKYIR